MKNYCIVCVNLKVLQGRAIRVGKDEGFCDAVEE